MLVLSRKTHECVVIDGRIIVKIVRIDGEVVKVGIQAPPDVPVHRQEVYDEIQRNNREAVTSRRPGLPKLPARPRRVATPGAGLPASSAVPAAAGDVALSPAASSPVMAAAEA